MRWVQSDKVLVPSRPVIEMIHLRSCCDFPRSYLQKSLGSFTFCSTEPKRKKDALYLMVSSPIISNSQLHQSIIKEKKRCLMLPAFIEYPIQRVRFQTVQPYPFHFIVLTGRTWETLTTWDLQLSESRKQTAREERTWVCDKKKNCGRTYVPLFHVSTSSLRIHSSI